MDCVARLVYGTLVWREKRRAKVASREEQAGTLADKAHHLKVGAHGETLAYWYLRRAGYVIVAKNRRPHSRSGELDMVGWDGPVLAFIEVKTRTGDEAGTPETAVGRDQQKRIAISAHEYMRRMKGKPAAYRFDIASVLWNSTAGYQVRVIKDAFSD